MKYIITEQQRQKLKDYILNYFQENLIPFRGWKTPKEYKKDLKFSDDELFLFLEDPEDFSGESSHMWYSTYKNPHVSLSKEDSPVVMIPDEFANHLDGLCGDLWIPFFKEWFTSHTGLPVNKVDGFNSAD